MENALNVTPHQHGTVIRISCSAIPEIVDCDEALDLFCSPVFQLSRTLILFFILVKVEEYKRTYGQNNRGVPYRLEACMFGACVLRIAGIGHDLIDVPIIRVPQALRSR